MLFRQLIQWAALLLCIPMIACGGAGAVTPDSKHPAARKDPPQIEVPADESHLSLAELEVICSRPPSALSPGGFTLEKVEKEIAEADREIHDRQPGAASPAPGGAAAGPPKRAAARTVEACREEAESLRNLIDIRVSSTRTLCDMRSSAGIGIPAGSLLDRTLAARNAIESGFVAAAAGTLKDCEEGIARMNTGFRTLRETAEENCAPSAAQRALLTCGLAAGDVQTRESTERVCAAYAEGRLVPAADTQKIAGCLKKTSPKRELRNAGAAVASVASDGSRAARDTRFAGAGLETAILQGAADFLVERAEQEIGLFAVEAVSDRLCKDASVTLEIFTNTCALLKPKEDAETPLGPTPAALREAVRADLEALPDFVAGKLKEKDPRYACAATLGWSIAEEALHGAPLADLLTDPELVLSKALVATHCDQSTKNDLRKVAEALKKVLDGGSPFERAALVRAGRIDAVLGAVANGQWGELEPVIRQVLMRLRELDKAHSTYEKAPSAETRAALVVSGVRTVEPILVFLVERQRLVDVPDPTKLDVKQKLDVKTKAASDVHLAVELVSALANREYAAAVVTASRIEVMGAVVGANGRNLLGLGASLAQAKSSDDVRATLNDAALPLGSWRRKNELHWQATLTGFVGGHVAYENVTEDAADGRDVSSGASLAPTLLVGADLQHGLGKGWRAGLLLNVLDLGALGTIRLDEPEVAEPPPTDASSDEASVSEEPEVRVEQVFAPGIYALLAYGPFTLGAGGSFVPALRPAKNTLGEAKALNVMRYGAFLAVDVSVLPLF